ncbi:MAG: FHA domain-containing protein [Lachnospiraceae bacterium]|nr:FHA domain-containing protein [Lachnospiraceae bacterium]
MLKDVIIANKLYAKMVEADDKLDDISLKVLKQDSPEFLLPMRCIGVDGERELRYEIVDGTRFSYFSEKMQKGDFARLLKNMLLPYKNCQDWFLDYHNLLLDPEHIILRHRDYFVWYLYLPQKEPAQTDAEIERFFENLIMSTELVNDSSGYAMRLLRVLKGSNTHVFGLLEELMKEEQPSEEQPAPESVRETLKAVPQPGSWRRTPEADVRPMAQEHQPSEKKEQRKPAPAPGGGMRPGQNFGEEDVEGGLLKNLFGEEEEEETGKKGKSKTREKKEKPAKEPKSSKQPKPVKEPKPEKGGGFLGGIFGSKAAKASDSGNDSVAEQGGSRQQPMEPAPVVSSSRGSAAGYYGDDGATVFEVTERDMEKETVFLQLIDSGGYALPREIQLDLSKGFVTVGRCDKAGNAQCDYNFSASISFISRSHMRIERKENQLQIIDMGSSNGTYLNREKIVPNMAYPLQRGDTIGFSRSYSAIYQVC